MSDPGRRIAGAVDGVAPRHRRSRRTAKIALSIGGLATLGGAAYLAVEMPGAEPVGHQATFKLETTPADSADSPSPEATALPSVTRYAPASEPPVTDAERIASARAGAKNSVPIKHPLPEAGAAATPVDLRVEESAGLKGRTLRVVSARSDLTGHNELNWVAGRGTRVGSASCSQTVRFADKAAAAHKPNLLICWRTSTAKSVYTVMVDSGGKPSRSDSVAAIAQRWSKLG